VLRAGKGDCNEHTALFVSLARAVGIPSRIAAGLVYHPALGQAYFYHAWPEVRLGADDASGQAGWVPVDPTFGQVPADARHLKLVEGDLAQQAQILSVMGRIRLRVVR
jgi:transglutaminase-like putative cysteine protease